MNRFKSALLGLSLMLALAAGLYAESTSCCNGGACCNGQSCCRKAK